MPAGNGDNVASASGGKLMDLPIAADAQIRISFDFRIESAPSALLFRVGTARNDAVYVLATNGTLQLWSASESFVTQRTSILVTMRVWHRLALTVDFAEPTGRATLAVDGADVWIFDFAAAEGQPTLTLGYGEPGPYRIDYDNLVVE